MSRINANYLHMLSIRKPIKRKYAKINTKRSLLKKNTEKQRKMQITAILLYNAEHKLLGNHIFLATICVPDIYDYGNGRRNTAATTTNVYVCA